MRKALQLIIVSLSSLSMLIACQKEASFEIPSNAPNTGNAGGPGSGPGNALIGSWKLIEMDARTYVSIEQSFAGDFSTSISNCTYLTKNNKGVLKIDAFKINFSDVGYEVEDTIHVKSYENGAFIDNSDIPFVFTMPTASSSDTYKLVGIDSIYFSGGFISIGGGASTASKPSGGKYKIQADTLTIITVSNESKVTTVSGVKETFVSQLYGVIKLKKQ
ncbi:MAG: hypothetical protein H7Y03_02780 [Chitinophagaceae bacterium]|nr:hypothetical protein [Chitinophagaceae bacterium]